MNIRAINCPVRIPGAAGVKNGGPFDGFCLTDGSGQPLVRQSLKTHIQNARSLISALDELAGLDEPPTFVVRQGAVRNPNHKQRTGFNLAEEIAGTPSPDVTRFWRMDE